MWQPEKGWRMLSFQKRCGDISEDVLSGGRGAVGDPQSAPTLLPGSARAALRIRSQPSVSLSREGSVRGEVAASPVSPASLGWEPRRPGVTARASGDPAEPGLLVSAQVSPGAGLPLPARPLLPARPSPAPSPPSDS